MEQKLSQHLARVRHLRESFAEANERLVARLRRADKAPAVPAADGGWTAAQIGWHVAAVNTRFAGIISGDAPAAAPLPESFTERAWERIASEIPSALKAPGSTNPPPAVSLHDAISALEESGMRMARAFDALTPERGGGFGITSPIVGGTITLYQVGEWAASHVIRHNRQAKRALGEG